MPEVGLAKAPRPHAFPPFPGSGLWTGALRGPPGPSGPLSAPRPAGRCDGRRRPVTRLPGPPRAAAALPRRRGGREDGARAVRHHPLLRARHRPRGRRLRHGARAGERDHRSSAGKRPGRLGRGRGVRGRAQREGRWSCGQQPEPLCPSVRCSYSLQRRRLLFHGRAAPYKSLDKYCIRAAFRFQPACQWRSRGVRDPCLGRMRHRVSGGF